MAGARASSMDDLFPSVPTLYLYRYPLVQDIITPNIQKWQGGDVAMKRLSIHENIPCGKVLYFDRLIMHSNTTKFFVIPSPLPEYNIPIHKTNCSCKVRQSSHITTYPKKWKLKWEYSVVIFSMHHISKKIKIEMRVLCYYFSILLNDAFSSILSFPWFHFLLNGAYFLPSFFPSPPVPLGIDGNYRVITLFPMW